MPLGVDGINNSSTHFGSCTYDSHIVQIHLLGKFDHALHARIRHDTVNPVDGKDLVAPHQVVLGDSFAGRISITKSYFCEKRSEIK